MLHVLNILQQGRLDVGRAAQIGVAANASSSSKIRKYAETMLFRAVTVQFDDLEVELMKYWMHSECLHANIYRLAQSLMLPTTIRTNVRGDDQEISTSTCVGLSRGKGAAPYCNMPKYLKELTTMVLDDLKAKLPLFTFTSLQINKEVYCKPHTDHGNIGPSATMSLGPQCGGFLWSVDAQGTCVYNAHEQWVTFDGRLPHGNIPFYGSRLSFVAFTHAAASHKEGSKAVAQAVEAGFPVPTNLQINEVQPAIAKYASMSTVQVNGVYEDLCREVLEAADSVYIEPTTRDRITVESSAKIAA